jgi:cysteine desulfurase
MIEPDDIIYLDNNATTRSDPAVLEEMRPYLEKYYGNPSSGYRFGSQVRDAINLARERVAALLACSPGEVVFTSGGTEATNTAINSAFQIHSDRRHIVTTTVEHNATLRFCEALATRGIEMSVVPVDGDGEIDLAELEAAIRPDTAIVSAMWANNETGVLFPIAQIAEVARKRRVLFHTDAVQAVGKVPTPAGELPINFLSVSAHKLYGPKGIGALYVNRRTAFRPLLLGGGQEEARRAGTENVAAIVGFGKAAELALVQLQEGERLLRALRDKFETALRAQVPGISINGAGAERLPNTTSVSFSGVDSRGVVILADQHGVCCSGGAACHSGSHQSSHVLDAMGVGAETGRGTIRFSLGRFNTDEEIERAGTIVTRVIAKLRGTS